MFDKEHAILKWKKTLKKNHSLEESDIIELEGHLRDKIDDLVKLGHSEEDAFADAEAEFLHSTNLEEAYYQSRSFKNNARPPWKPPRFIPGLMWAYFKTAVRHFKRRKFFSLVNIAGLSFGLACCVVILLYIDNEASYDQFHQDAGRIYRILEYRKVPAGEFCMAEISPMVTTVLRNDFPQVKIAARVFPVENTLVEVDHRRNFEDRVFYSESDIFKVLTIKFIKGNSETALKNPNNLVLSSSMAKKYFGDKDCLGQRISITDPTINRMTRRNQSIDYVITGVVEDPPSNTHFKYNFFLPLSQFNSTWLLKEWHAGATLTYIKLAPEVSPIDFDKKIKLLAYNYVSKELTAWGQTRNYFLQPLTKIHFQGDYKGLSIRGELEAPGNPNYFIIYGILALLVLLIGCMNFINLSNARGVERIKEIGLRKVVGAGRRQLILQLLGEAILITFTAAFFAILLVQILLPLFNQFAGTTITTTRLIDPNIISVFFGMIITVGILSGIYPAFVLTAFRPNQILKGMNPKTGGSFTLKILVIGQFAISIFLATGAIAAYKQLSFLRSGDLGFDKEHKYVIPIRKNKKIRDSVKTIKNEFLRNPQILGITASSSVPGRPLRNSYLSWSDSKLDKPLRLDFLSCDGDFLKFYKIDVVSGRAFDEALNDEAGAFLINEAAVPYLGYTSPENSLGDKLYESFYGKQKTIVGVIKNFHFHGLEKEVAPMFLEVSSSRFDMLTFSLAPSKISETLGFLKTKWYELFPDIPFDGFFLDKTFDLIYRKEAQMGKMLAVLTGMGLVAACMGLFGLVSFVVKQRTKEIGIRKVLGATVPSIVKLLSQRFVILIFLSNVLSIPLALIAIKHWLQDFVLRINLNWDIFVFAGGAALLIALIPILIQVFRAARTNPVDSLRYE